MVRGLAALAMRILSVRPSVCLSVCVPLSVKRMDCDKKEEKSVRIFIYHAKDHLA